MTWQYISDRLLVVFSPETLTALAVFVMAFAVLWAIKHIVLSRFQKIAHSIGGSIGDTVVHTIGKIGLLFYAVVAAAITVTFVSLPPGAATTLHSVILVALVVEATRITQRIVLFLLERRLFPLGKQPHEGIVSLLKIGTKTVLWTLALLVMLSNLGIEVTALVASLGVGGIAVALAVQNILGDLFNSISLYVDRPFETGDFIVVGPHMGTVQRIGLKTTRILALSGEELVISNSELTSTRIQNFKKMTKRRVLFSFGVEYATPTAKLKRAKELVTGIIGKTGGAELDRVHFREFGDSALLFEVVYFVQSGDYNVHMDLREQINLAIAESFEQEGIHMAFPTQTVHLVQEKTS
ncbi:MAG: mechanosensitive ion channel family protein [Candidatus Peribacteraceae bacterium]|nr:mechanosensitive ion channel family protein [Candidatus Peribacteraceae bacterium]MDD5742552.1 mechanosensitive ion channel family protein [Candidatus Peribacteraceae bacterium]